MDQVHFINTLTISILSNDVSIQLKEKWFILVSNVITENFDICKTNGGASPNTKCVIPFKYNDVTYNNCAKDEDGFWCSTKIDSLGIHVGGEGNWGTCGPNCLLPGN